MVETNYVASSRQDSELKRTVINVLTMEQFTSKEYLDMVLLYEEFRQNSRAAARLYTKRRTPYHRTITAAVQRIADTWKVMPNHARAGTSLAVAAVLQTRLMKQANFLGNYERQRNIYLKLFERQDLKYWQIHFVAVVTFHPVNI